MLHVAQTCNAPLYTPFIKPCFESSISLRNPARQGDMHTNIAGIISNAPIPSNRSANKLCCFHFIFKPLGPSRVKTASFLVSLITTDFDAISFPVLIIRECSCGCHSRAFHLLSTANSITGALQSPSISIFSIECSRDSLCSKPGESHLPHAWDSNLCSS